MAGRTYLDFAGALAGFGALGSSLPNARSRAPGASSAPTSTAIALKRSCCTVGLVRLDDFF